MATKKTKHDEPEGELQEPENIGPPLPLAVAPFQDPEKNWRSPSAVARQFSSQATLKLSPYFIARVRSPELPRITTR